MMKYCSFPEADTIVLCNTCYQENNKTASAIDRPIKGLTAINEKMAAEPPAKTRQYAKAKLLQSVTTSLLSDEALLLAAIVDLLNSILEELGQPTYKNITLIREWLERELSPFIDIQFVRGKSNSGYLIRRKNVDIIATLFNALQRQRTAAIPDRQFQATPAAVNTDRYSTLDEQVLLQMSSEVYSQSKEWEPLRTMKDLTSASLNSIISLVSPRLWKLVWCLTSSKGKRNNSWSDADDAQKSTIYSARRITCLFLLAVMAHTANPACHYPLHLILADIVDSRSSSSELLDFLSRIGICSSRDTLDRMKTKSIIQRISGDLQEELSKKSFTITSIDNIDRSAPGKRISANSTERGFHGTSVQNVAPMPSQCMETMVRQPAVQEFNNSLPDSRSRSLCEAKVQCNFATVGPPLYLVQPRLPVCQVSVTALSLSPSEAQALQQAKEVVHDFMLGRIADEGSTLKVHFGSSVQQTNTEKSIQTIVGISPDSPDRMDTIKAVLDEIHNLHRIESGHHVVVGDQKIFSLVHRLKRQYGVDLDWVLPYPGDWHFLKAIQPILLKIYFHAGLGDLAAAAGYNGGNLTALQGCSSFKHTHTFLLEVFEGLYKYLLRTLNVTGSFSDFTSALEEHAASYSTLRLWGQFVTQDCMEYILLWLAIRCGQWNLRCGIVKSTSALFHAFDRRNYAELSAVHLADLCQLPNDVRDNFSKGAFVVSISGVPSRRQALDEAHESGVNRKTKAVLNRADAEYIQRTAHYIPYRAALQGNIIEQVLPNSQEGSELRPLANHGTAALQQTVSAIISKLEKVDMKKPGPLQNVFTGKIASNDEHRGMLDHRKIGQEKLKMFFESRVLSQISVQTTVRREKLATMTEKKKKKSRVKTTKPQKTMVLALKAQLYQSQVSQQAASAIGQQYSLLPKAFVTDNGTARQPTKSNMRKIFESRFPQAFSTGLQPPSNKATSAVIIDSMFIIQSAPLSHHLTFADYAKCMLGRWVVAMLKQGDSIHLVFDHPGRYGQSPKDVERTRRDGDSAPCTRSHTERFDLDSACPKANDWVSLLKCRSCKRRLVSSLATCCLKLFAMQNLAPNQTLVCAGAFDGEMVDQAWQSSSGVPPTRSERFDSKHEEADSRVWLHARQFERAVIYSPDTDVVMIGLPLFNQGLTTNVIVRYDTLHHGHHLYVNVNELHGCIQRDPDLAALPPEQRCKAMQTFYIATGCDFVSSFAGLGKKTFFKAFCANAAFVTGPLQVGSLAGGEEHDFLAFIRLVLCAYCSQHRSTFLTTPANLFAEMTDMAGSADQRHKEFLTNVRNTIWPKVAKEEDNVPSWTSLHCHWLRTQWVASVWSAALQPDYSPPALTSHGWKLALDDSVEVVWDTDESMQHIKQLIVSLTTGCRCKSGCKTRRCKCVKDGASCSASCKCLGCVNKTPNLSPQPPDVTGEQLQVAQGEDISTADESDGYSSSSSVSSVSSDSDGKIF